MKILFILLISLSVNLYAKCWFLSCVPSVNVATTTTTNALQKEFNKINELLDDIKKAYKEQNKLLEENNKTNSKIVRLKKEYLLLLKEISFELEKRKGIK